MPASWKEGQLLSPQAGGEGRWSSPMPLPGHTFDLNAFNLRFKLSLKPFLKLFQHMKQTFCRYVQRPGADEDSNPVSGSGLGNPVGRSLPYGGGGASYLDPGGEAAPSSQDYDHPHHHHHHYHSSAPLAAALACAPSSSGSFILASSLQVGDGMLIHNW